MNSIERIEIMFEEMNSKFDFLVEAITILQKDVNEMKPMVACIPRMLKDIDSIKLISREHSLELNDHEGRLSRLQAT